MTTVIQTKQLIQYSQLILITLWISQLADLEIKVLCVGDITAVCCTACSVLRVWLFIATVDVLAVIIGNSYFPLRPHPAPEH